MKAKLIYEQGKSYYGGRNPYNDDWKYVIEYNGKYYELHQWGNYNSRGKTLRETDFDPENIPEEYERDDGNTEYYLKHGNNSVMEIDLTEIDNSGGPLSIPESLVGEYKKEYREKMRELNKNLMQLTIDKVEEYKEKEEYGKGYASIMYATTSKGTKIILYDYHHKDKIMPNHGSDIDNRQYLYPIELWEWAKKNYGSRYEEMPYDISSFELVSSEEVEREECIKISDYIFSGPDMVGRDVSKEYEEIKDKIYQEYREAYDLEMIGTFETYCPLEYQKMLERENISEEQKEIIKKLAKMRAYCKDSYLKEKMDEKIEEFINGKAIFVKGNRFTQGYNKVLESMGAYDAKDVENAKEPDVMSFLWSDDVKIISLGDKQIELLNGEKYNGTYKAGGKYWDVLIDSEGNCNIDRQLLLPFDRFDVETGDTNVYKEFNEECRKEKQAKREFYESVINDVQDTFGLSKSQAKVLLKYAGTVTALLKTVQLGKAGISGQELQAIARKTSYDGVHSVSENVSSVFKGARLDVFQDAAETLQYLDYLLGGQDEREKRVKQSKDKITLGDIGRVIDKRKNKGSVSKNDDKVTIKSANIYVSGIQETNKALGQLRNSGNLRSPGLFLYNNSIIDILHKR